MRKLSITILFFCFGVISLFAQSETQAFNVGGIKVIFKPTTKKIIDIRIYFKGGVTNYEANQAGIEEVALNAAAQCGTQKYRPAAFRDSSDKYGILINGSSTYDFGLIEVNCISKYFDRAWDMFADAVINPAFDSNEVALSKEKEIGVLRKLNANPDDRLFELQVQNAFRNTPYATAPEGTEETLKKFTPLDLKNYYHSILNKKQVFLVVVGNINKQELVEKILSAFAGMPAAPYLQPDLKTPVLNDNKLLADWRDIKINYISAIMNAPAFSDINNVPFRMGITALGGNLYQYLHAERNLSYQTGTTVFAKKMPFAVMYAASNNTRAAMDAMLLKLRQIKIGGLNNEWLQHLKSIYFTSSFINDQSTASIAARLGSAEILGGWQYADEFPQQVQTVTVQQVNSALNYYIVGLRWTLLGKPGAIEGIKPPPY